MKWRFEEACHPGTQPAIARECKPCADLALNYLITTSVPKPAGESWDQGNPSLAWRDWAEVKEDGSFELPSFFKLDK